MQIKDTTTPVLVLCCEIGGLGIFRSLGSLGVSVYGVDKSSDCVAFHSKYCKHGWVQKLNPLQPKTYLDFLLERGKELSTKHHVKHIVLIPTSDILSEFVCAHHQQLSDYFTFQYNDPKLIDRIVSKKRMYALAKEFQIPTPHTLFPQNLDELITSAGGFIFPVMLKAINGDTLYQRSGIKMLIINSFDELLEQYKKLEDFDHPNLMVQEYIPGDDDQVYIFNGYFNKNSDCLVAYTGHKIRQHPIHRGCASLGISTWIEEFSNLNQSFMKNIAYFGILDIGYRLDPRDGLYKVLDINPRIGGAFRLFVSENGMDVVRSLYLDLTGQEQQKSKPIEGRKWMIEDWDFISSVNYFREGSLRFIPWIQSFKRLEELAWFDWRDPKPFFYQSITNIKKAFTYFI